MRLSILICHLTKRECPLRQLLNVLNPQLTQDVQIIVEADDGQQSIGAKRNALLEKATGDYIAFIDDDDLVSADYISKIFEATSTNPDCCAIWGARIWMNVDKFHSSLQYDKWGDKDGILCRPINHLNPVRRELALGVKFPNFDYCEDKFYALNLRKVLKNEVEIPGLIYLYRFSVEQSESVLKERATGKSGYVAWEELCKQMSQSK